MTLHRATRVDRRTLALYCGEQLYGYLVVSPTPRFVAQGRLHLVEGDPNTEPTREEIVVQRRIDSLPGSLPLLNVLRELRGAVEDAWASADQLDHFAARHALFEAESQLIATHNFDSAARAA